MPSIEESGFSLVFKVPAGVSVPVEPKDAMASQQIALRVHVRALDGMQKEAVVAFSTGTDQQTWRMVSDEGPYLDGTDLAPFPLGFFSAGMQFSLLSELLRHAKAHHVTFTSLELQQDNYYSMNGSALQGTMIGGAKPVEVQLRIESEAPTETIAKLIALAEQSSPAHALMREVLANTFSLKFNEKALPVTNVKASSSTADKPDAVFEAASPDTEAKFRDAIITKLTAAERLEGVEGGASSSLQPVQKRILHVHGRAKLLEDNLLEATVQVKRPIGSEFRFLCEVNLDEQLTSSAAGTPPPLAYLSAGVGFCYMTQLGRYAHITKQSLQSYQIVQENTFTINEASDDPGLIAHALPFDTHVFYEADEADEVAQKTVSMGERTCFLHAAMRDSYPSNIQVELNGKALPLD